MTQLPGSQNTQAILSEPEVEQILLLLKRGWTQAAVGQLYGVSRKTVSSIKCGVSWKHLWTEPSTTGELTDG
jgi:DNA-binding NarL/FixJ family response regulator